MFSFSNNCTETASLAGATTETLRNVELVKSLGLEDQETKRLNDVNQKILSLELKKIKLIRYLSFIQGTFINSIRSGIMLLMMWLIWQGVITFGEFFTLYIYQFFLIEPLGMLGTIANTYQETSASMEKLENILKMEPEQKPKNAVTLGKIESIKYDNVSFTYNETGVASVKNINFSTPRPEANRLAAQSALILKACPWALTPSGAITGMGEPCICKTPSITCVWTC
jgi:ATP-binding cassette subfamily B protein